MIEKLPAQRIEATFRRRQPKGINPQHVEKIETILGLLNVAQQIEDVDVHSFRLHPLTGNLKGFWSMTVRANWRIIFRFENGSAFEVDLVDYH
jgi:toxin HigB-1